MSKFLDYTGLEHYNEKVQGQISQLGFEVHGREDTAIDPTSYEQLKGHLGTSSAWGTSVNSRHIFIPCSPGDVFELTANPTTGTNYAFMPDAPVWVSGGAVTTLGGRIALSAGNSTTATAPTGANYLYIQTLTSGKVDSSPSSIILKAAPGIDQSITNLNTKAAAAEKGIKELNLFDENVLNIQYSVLANKTGYAGNSMGHFMHGIRKGFNALKADMRLTSDGYIILCHDAGYTLNSAGKITGYDASSANTTPIHDMTLAQCKALEFNTPDASGNYYHPVELSEFIYLCKYYGIIPFITLREDAYRTETSTAMAAILKKYGMESRTLINLYMSPANLADTTAILDETAPNVKRCYTMLEGWSMSIANLTHGLNCGCQYICTFRSHQGDITDELCVFMAENNGRLLSIINSEEEYNSTTENGYVGFQSYADYAPVRTPASISLELAESA